MKEITKTERGWAGHYICSDSCNFRRNTLVELGDKKIVVSTVGNMYRNGKHDTVGYNRNYETMAFWAKYDKPYWEADVTKQIDFKHDWAIEECEFETDKKANEMHEEIVYELCMKLQKGQLGDN